MEFTIAREVLLKVLKHVSGVIERRQPTQAILANVLMRVNTAGVTFVATDQEIELLSRVGVQQVATPGAITVPFRRLHEIAKVLPEKSMLSVGLQQNKVLLRSGTSRFTLSTLPSEHFPDVEMAGPSGEVGELVLEQKAFRGLIEKTAFAMAEKDVRYFLNGMLLELKADKLYAVAADGHRLMVNTLKLDSSMLIPASFRVIVPRKGILEMLRIMAEDAKEVRLTVNRTHIRLKNTLMTMTSKLLEGKYPDYEALIPKAGGDVVVGNRERLKELFYRASALFCEKVRGVRLRISHARLEILGKNAEHDEVEDEVEVAYQGKCLEVGFNVLYLIHYLLVARAQEIRLTFTGPDSSILIEEVGDSSGKYVVMPIRM